MTAGVKGQRQWEIGYWTVKYLVAVNQNHRVPHEHATGSQLLTINELPHWSQDARTSLS